MGSFVEMVPIVPVVAHLSYAHHERARRLAQSMGAAVSDVRFTDEVRLDLRFRAADADSFIRAISKLTSGSCRVRACDPRFGELQAARSRISAAGTDRPLRRRDDDR